MKPKTNTDNSLIPLFVAQNIKNIIDNKLNTNVSLKHLLYFVNKKQKLHV